MIDRPQQLRLVEALLFAAPEPLDLQAISARLPTGSDVEAILSELRETYANRGINVLQVAGRWTMRTSPDFADALKIEIRVPRKPSRAAIETLAIIAYHQPVTRAEIEEIRGVGISPGTVDFLLERGWIKPGRRRPTPGRPLTFVTSESFLEYFGLESLADLPGVSELRAAGLLDARPAIIAIGGDPAAAQSMPLGRPDDAEPEPDSQDEVEAREESGGEYPAELPLVSNIEVEQRAEPARKTEDTERTGEGEPHEPSDTQDRRARA
jgi:segregation and condensation protein B